MYVISLFLFSNNFFISYFVHSQCTPVDNWLAYCQNNVTRIGIKSMCLQCDISVRHHYKMFNILSATSKHSPGMPCNLLTGKINPIQTNACVMKRFVLYHTFFCIYNFTSTMNTPCHEQM